MHQKEGFFQPSSVTLKSWAKEQFAYFRKRKRDNASKAKQRKIDVQQTRTRDLLKLLCQDEEVFTVVADIDGGGKLKLKRALELQEINFSVLRTLQPRSHYNSLLFLRKEGFFAEDAVKIDERLESKKRKKLLNF